MSGTTTPTCICGVPVRDGYACHDCTAQLGRNLVHLAGVIPALEQVAAVGRGGGIPTFTVGRKWVAEDKPLPLNEAAMGAIGHCWDEGVVLCSELVGGFMEPARTPRKAVGMLAYAAEHVDLIRREEDAATLIDDVIDLMDEVGRVLNRAEEVRQSQATTDARNLEAFHTDMTLANALLWLNLYRGVEIPKQTARDWIKKGRLPERRHPKTREHMAIPSTLLEVAKGRRTTAA